MRIGRWTWIWFGSTVFLVLLIGWLLYSTHREPEAVSLAPSAGSDATQSAAGENVTGEKMTGETTIGQAASVAPAAALSGVKRPEAGPAGPANSLAAVPPVEGLTLLRPSLRHGGLGSQALMTFAIRNSNDYPVKDIRLACTFSSRDGSYVTERRHLIHGVVKANSRKIFRSLLLGFVSIGASRAKCAVLSADWA